MEKLDRLVWTAGFSITAYGLRIGVRFNRPEAVKCILDYLPPDSRLTRSTLVERLYSFVVGGDEGRDKIQRFHLVYGNDLRIARSLDLEYGLRSFESDLQFFVAEEAPRRVFVHAGAVAWRGRAVVIPGKSFSGKTTLVAELVKAGAVYYSDEYAVLDAQGLVHPYARPLAIRRDRTRESQKHSVESLGGKRGRTPLPVGLVVVTEYRPGARWRPRRLSPGQGALALLNNSVSIKSRPEASFPVLKQTAMRSRFLKSRRGEAQEVADLILSELERG